MPGTAVRKHSFPKKVSDQDKQVLRKNLGDINSHVGRFRELDLTRAAMDIYHRWYMGGERSVHAKRLDTYALRLMSLLAVNDLKNEVDEDTVQKVIALCDWQLEVRKLHDPIDADNKIAKMEEKIRRVLGAGPKKMGKLKQSVNANRAGLWFFEAARKNLDKAGEIVQEGKTKQWRLV